MKEIKTIKAKDKDGVEVVVKAVVNHNFTGTQGHLSDIAVSEEDVVDSEKYIAMGDENGKILVWR